MPNVPCALKVHGEFNLSYIKASLCLYTQGQNHSFVKPKCSRVMKASHLPVDWPTAASFTAFSVSHLMQRHVIVSEIGVKGVTTQKYVIVTVAPAVTSSSPDGDDGWAHAPTLTADPPYGEEVDRI
jgi:hypothetical protein